MINTVLVINDKSFQNEKEKKEKRNIGNISFHHITLLIVVMLSHHNL